MNIWETEVETHVFVNDILITGFYILTAASVKSTILWDAMPGYHFTWRYVPEVSLFNILISDAMVHNILNEHIFTPEELKVSYRQHFYSSNEKLYIVLCRYR